MLPIIIKMTGELAQDALMTLAKRLSTQAKTVHDATLRAMNFVAHLHETKALYACDFTCSIPNWC